MFDSVCGHGNVPKGRLGTGAVVSVLLHVVLIAGSLWLSTRPPPEEKKDVSVTFFAAAPLPPPPPPPPPPKKRSPDQKPKVKKPDVIVQPKEIPQEKPSEAEPPPEEEPPASEESDEGMEGGVEGGVVGGVIGGVLGGQIGATEVLPFGEGMSRPEQIEGRDPIYSREALEAHVQGLMIVKCVITTEGRLENCRIIKPLPFMDKAVLDALSTRRYKPVTYQGKPVTVDYVFNIRLVMPTR